MGFMLCAIVILIVICLYGSNSKIGKNIAKEFGIRDDGDAFLMGCLSVVIIIFFGFFGLLFAAMLIH